MLGCSIPRRWFRSRPIVLDDQFSVQFKDFLQQRPGGLFRFVGRFCGIGNMSVSSEAIVRICERLMRRQIKDRARRFFFQHAKRRLCIWHVNGFGWERGIIKRVPRIRIFGHLDVLGRPFEAVKIGSARSDFDPVVRSSVKDADWMVGHVSIADVSRDAWRIERNIGRRINPACVPHFLKSFERRIKSRLSSA